MADPAGVVHAEAVPGPGTHALVVGVGSYPFLLGGIAPAERSDGMRQLTSPPVSARAFADWLAAEYHHPAAPLASLALLLSEEEPAPWVNPRTGQPCEPGAATIAAVTAAVTAWKQRGDSSPDNRLILYFCGHGISEGDDMALLASDFNPDDANPLNQALDFSRLRHGLKRCAASQQLFFVDACRASSDVLISQSGALFAGQVPLLPGMRPLELPRLLSVPYYATLAGDLSHARPGAVSLFTEALLRGLRGAGSDDPEGDWRVTTIGLQEAIDHFLKQPVFAGRVAGVQVPVVGELPGFDVHELIGLPVVPVYVGCAPPEGNATAEFVCRQDGAERLRRARDAVADAGDPLAEWAVELEFGEYEFVATLDAGEVRSRSLTVRPAYRRVRLGSAP